MRIVALLSWFDESPTMLAGCVSSLTKLGVEHLVAVDGAYLLMSGARAVSGIDQTRVVTDVTSSLGIGLTLHQPGAPFAGNEVEKRSLLLRLALAQADPEDWLFIIDADEAVVDVRGDARGALVDSAHDVALVGMVQRVTGQEGASPMPRLIRALRGLHYESNHYTILDGDRVVCPPSDSTDLSGVVRVEHRRHLRDAYRAERADAYYQLRDATSVEHEYQGVTA